MCSLIIECVVANMNGEWMTIGLYVYVSFHRMCSLIIECVLFNVA